MITTFQQHIQAQQQSISEASGTFSYLLAGITLATKMIQAKIRLAAIDNIYGAIGQTNEVRRSHRRDFVEELADHPAHG